MNPERFRMKRTRRLSLSEMFISNAPTPFSLLLNVGELKLIWPISTDFAAAGCAAGQPEAWLAGPISGYAPLGGEAGEGAEGAVPKYFFIWFRLVWLKPGEELKEASVL